MAHPGSLRDGDWPVPGPMPTIESFAATVLADAAWFDRKAAIVRPRLLGDLLREHARQLRAYVRGWPLPQWYPQWCPCRITWPNTGLEGVCRYQHPELQVH